MFRSKGSFGWTGRRSSSGPEVARSRTRPLPDPDAVEPEVARSSTPALPDPEAVEPDVARSRTRPLPDPDAVEPEVAALLLRVPELVPRYLTLAEAADGDPGAPAVFEALADLVTDLVKPTDEQAPVLGRYLDALELVASSSPEAEELVGWAFLDALDPSARRQIAPWLGAHTAAIAEHVDEGGLGGHWQLDGFS